MKMDGDAFQNRNFTGLRSSVPHHTHGQADKLKMFFENLSGIWGFGLWSLLWVVDPIIPSIDQPANRLSVDLSDLSLLHMVA
jgi:hypothetical protein